MPFDAEDRAQSRREMARRLSKGEESMHASIANLQLGCALAAIMASTGALAQTAPVAADGEIIVTARKVAENVQDVPISMTAIGGAALERRSVQSIADIQQQVPNPSYSAVGL